jgi:predicted nucleic acid-binding protein
MIKAWNYSDINIIITLYIPTAVLFELYTGQGTKRTFEVERIETLLFRYTLVDLSLEIAKLGGFLVRDYPRIKDPIDAFIAATTLHLEAELATRNKKDFEFIEGLKFYEDI